MIKKLQSLKKKKGFTLVELIVVIAIIGVLAAILVPTMLGYVTSSRVTSANSTAASIKNNVDSFLTACDTAGYGMLKGSANNSQIAITVTGGTWTVTNPTPGAFKNGSGKTWSNTPATGTAGASKVNVNAPESLLAIELADLFPEINTASMVIYVEGGKTLAVAYTADTDAGLTVGTDCPGITAGTTTAGGWTQTNGATVFAWDNSTAGVSSSGFIVGTAPTVALG